MYRYLIVIEKADENYSAYSPDLPGCVATGRDIDEVRRNMHGAGCVATGRDIDEVRRNMHGAIEMHLQGLREDKLPIPEPSTSADYVSVA